MRTASCAIVVRLSSFILSSLCLFATTAFLSLSLLASSVFLTLCFFTASVLLASLCFLTTAVFFATLSLFTSSVFLTLCFLATSFVLSSLRFFASAVLFTDSLIFTSLSLLSTACLFADSLIFTPLSLLTATCLFTDSFVFASLSLFTATCFFTNPIVLTSQSLLAAMVYIVVTSVTCSDYNSWCVTSLWTAWSGNVAVIDWHVITMSAEVTSATVCSPTVTAYVSCVVVRSAIKEKIIAIMSVYYETPCICNPCNRAVEILYGDVVVVLPAVKNVSQILVSAIPQIAVGIAVMVEVVEIVEVYFVDIIVLCFGEIEFVVHLVC